jgi:hypothetical protein
MTPARRIAAVAAAALIGIAGLTACSGGGSADPTEPGPVTAPIIVESSATEVTAEVGQELDFKVPDPAKASISSSDTNVVTVTQGGESGGAMMNPGGKAVGAGTSTITIDYGDGSAQVVAVTVK